MILAVTMNPAIDKIYFVKSFNIDKVHRPDEMIASAGGKGLNVARVAKLVGENVAASGYLGGGNGKFISKKIEALGLVDRFVQIDDETRICINITDLTNHTCTEVLEAGPTISETQEQLFLDSFVKMIEDVDIITLSGSLPKGLAQDFYGKLITIAKTYNKPVLLDTSGDAFMEGVKAKPFLIKPNEEEIKAIYQGPVETLDDLVEAIKYFKKFGIKLPIISLGKDGSLAGLSDGIYKVTFPKIEVVNTVGSGDAFIAGCAVGLSRKMKESDILKFATACGSANTQYLQTGFVEQSKVDEYFKKVSIEKIADY